MAKKRRKFTQCPNCGYSFEDVNNYCPNCGQENHDLNVPVKHLIAEFFEGTIHFDTKIWRTLKLLILKPGLLTEKFNVGQRASYVPPFRLYVFISIVFFFLLALNHSIFNVRAPEINKLPAEERQRVKEGFQEVEKIAPGFIKTEATIDSVARDRDSTAYSAELNFGNDETGAFMETKAKQFLGGGEASRAKLLKNTSFMMFLLMPLFGYLLYLFYLKQRRNYVEHLMFSIHLHSFWFLVLILVMLINFVLPEAALLKWAFLLMMVYLYLAMLRVYKSSYLKTLFKLLPIMLLYLICLLIFFLGNVVVSAVLA
ncbi:DUF3667 domain-containing protein [Pontibacter burrus]|uniref:DUF3667 domain-containing protein n=1 Tax=Pontibacter burrus TaxID=2704466 RepID=A0A6B3LQN0_9BACT|nr:DUF3667 domain-containing protein [Pontibacter burrus]NEM96516.1 DUF3667 domain-containing protein [Pontibacter burrus]